MIPERDLEGAAFVLKNGTLREGYAGCDRREQCRNSGTGAKRSPEKPGPGGWNFSKVSNFGKVGQERDTPKIIGIYDRKAVILKP